MNKSSIIIGAIVAVAFIIIALIIFSMGNYGPKFEEVKYLMDPRIIHKENTKALVVEATGAPKNTGGPAFGLLYKAYYRIKGLPKGKNMAVFLARWPNQLDTPKDQWLGIYAILVPPTVNKIPSVTGKQGLTIELREWKYGEVAEILHIGPYNTEDTTVAKLMKFITDKGYEICGAREEEYLKGPSFIPTDPKKYLTIIRYQVRKKIEISDES